MASHAKISVNLSPGQHSMLPLNPSLVRSPAEELQPSWASCFASKTKKVCAWRFGSAFETDMKPIITFFVPSFGGVV